MGRHDTLFADIAISKKALLLGKLYLVKSRSNISCGIQHVLVKCFSNPQFLHFVLDQLKEEVF